MDGLSIVRTDEARTPTRSAPKMGRGQSAGRFSRFITPEHKRMSRLIGYCLSIGTPGAWEGFTAVAAVRLSVVERGALAYAAMNSLDPEFARMTATAAFGAAGSPTPSFLGGMNDARQWAAQANHYELKAHALAAFEAMTAQDQAAFYQHISEVEIAA